MSSLRYDKEHTWVRIEGLIATLGIVKRVGAQTGEFVYADIVARGTKIEKGDRYVTLEAVKWSGDITSPLSGEIIETNEHLMNTPKLLNDQPYDAWIVKIRMSRSEETEKLVELTEGSL